MGKYGIPDEVLERIQKRDRLCVYCRKVMIFPYKPSCPGDSATIEHLAFDGPGYWDEGLTEEGLAYCCGTCNSSRGLKSLNEWFQSKYCIERKISPETVANPIKEFLKANDSG